MAVNAESQELAALLAALPRLVAPGGLAVLLTFHSLEDRAVKRGLAGAAWKDAAGGARAASAEEVAANPRARSAKLRAAVRRA